jgi:small subunit ribosomal protein S4
MEWKSKALCRLYFNGDVSERVFKQVYNASHRNMAETLGNMERRLDTIVFRSMFASSIFLARKMVSSGHVLVNGERIWRPSFAVDDGDVIQILPELAARVYRNINHPMIRLWSFIPRYLEVNFANLATSFLHQPQLPEIPSPFPPEMIRNFSAFYSKRG